MSRPRRHGLSAVASLALLAALLTPALGQSRPERFCSQVTTPRAQSYPLPLDLSRLRNSDALTKLTADQKARLARNGFVVIPDAAEQMFMLYEDYPSDTDQPVPNFITADSLLHAYHLFYDFSLRSVESNFLLPDCARLTDLCRYHSLKFWKSLPAGPLKEAAAANVVYFTVAQSLLAGKTRPTDMGREADALQAQELRLIAAHEGRAKSPLLGTTIHYSQFPPRGHYTRSEAFQRYFQTMMWYGLLGLELDNKDPELCRRHTRQALLITRILSGDDTCRVLWAKIYEPTVFYVGASDDLGFRQYAPLAREVFGRGLDLAALAEDSKLDSFLAQARATLPEPGIAPYFMEADAAGNLLRDTAAVQGRQFRLMGQRFIPDAYLLQQLVSPQVKPASPDDARDMPNGLDVAAVFGSDRARSLLLDTYRQGRYPQYTDQLTKLQAEFAVKPESDWWQNLYWGWLYSLKSLLGAFGEGYPAFMQTRPWEDKELQTALGSWSQLRHDTLLYAKPSGAEMGGAEPIPVQGYVEPVPEFWARLAYLNYLSREGLQARGLLSAPLAKAFSTFGGLLQFLKTCAEKELRGEALSAAECERIQYFGGELERLQLSVVASSGQGYGTTSWYEITNEADRHMATIADIHTSFDQALEVGVGPAYRLYVVTPRADGTLQVTKGGVFSYFEFTWPAGDRLTDEKWQGLLKAKQEPQQPSWTGSFVVGPAYPTYEDGEEQ